MVAVFCIWPATVNDPWVNVLQRYDLPELIGPMTDRVAILISLGNEAKNPIASGVTAISPDFWSIVIN